MAMIIAKSVSAILLLASQMKFSSGNVSTSAISSSAVTKLIPILTCNMDSLTLGVEKNKVIC